MVMLITYSTIWLSEIASSMYLLVKAHELVGFRQRDKAVT
jgi:hypothetical protein